MNPVQERIDGWQTLIKIFSSLDPRTHIGFMCDCVPLHRLHAKTPLDPLYYNPPPSLDQHTHSPGSSCTICRAATILHRERRVQPSSAALPIFSETGVCVCCALPPTAASSSFSSSSSCQSSSSSFLCMCTNLPCCCFGTGHSIFTTLHMAHLKILESGFVQHSHGHHCPIPVSDWRHRQNFSMNSLQARVWHNR